MDTRLREIKINISQYVILCVRWYVHLSTRSGQFKCIVKTWLREVKLNISQYVILCITQYGVSASIYEKCIIGCSCFVPSSQTKHTLLAGLRGVVTFGSSSRSGGSPLAARALAANSDTCGRGPAGGYAVYLDSGVPCLAKAFTSSRTFSRIAPSISGPQYSPQPRDFGDHEKAEGPPRGERRKLPITLSRQAKTQNIWLSIPGRPPLRSTPALVPCCSYG